MGVRIRIMRWSVCGGAARSVSHICHMRCLPSRKWQTLWRPVDQSAGFGALLPSRDWYGNTWRTRPVDLKTKEEQISPMKNGRSPWRDDQSRNKHWPNKLTSIMWMNFRAIRKVKLETIYKFEPANKTKYHIQSINQSINRTMRRSIIQSIDRSIDWTNKWSIDTTWIN